MISFVRRLLLAGIPLQVALRASVPIKNIVAFGAYKMLNVVKEQKPNFSGSAAMKLHILHMFQETLQKFQKKILKNFDG